MAWICNRCGSRQEGDEEHDCGPKTEIERRIGEICRAFDLYDGEVGRELNVIFDFLVDSGFKRMATRMQNTLMNDIKYHLNRIEVAVRENEMPDLEEEN